MLAALTRTQATQPCEIRPRGLTSIESSEIKNAKDKLKRAKQLGYETVQDRYDSDAVFAGRVHEEGKGRSDCIKCDMLTFAHLPDPPRTVQQVSAGVAANAEHEHLLTKLVYFSQPRGCDQFPFKYKYFVKVWGYMFGRRLCSEDEYIQYICKDQSHRNLLTWSGVVWISPDHAHDKLAEIYEDNLPKVLKNIERKYRQSEIAKTRRVEEEQQANQASTAASSAQAEASSQTTSPFLVPEPATPAEPASPLTGRSWTWSYCPDQYGSQSEWSKWRGQWYYRDEPHGRWIAWSG